MSVLPILINFFSAITSLETLSPLIMSAHSPNQCPHHCLNLGGPWNKFTFFFTSWISFFFFCPLGMFFFSFIFINWRLITLQYCSGFCHTLTWIRHGFTCIPHPNPPSHLPLHPIPLGLPSAPGQSTCLMTMWVSDERNIQHGSNNFPNRRVQKEIRRQNILQISYWTLLLGELLLPCCIFLSSETHMVIALSTKMWSQDFSLLPWAFYFLPLSLSAPLCLYLRDPRPHGWPLPSSGSTPDEPSASLNLPVSSRIPQWSSSVTLSVAPHSWSRRHKRKRHRKLL